MAKNIGATLSLNSGNFFNNVKSAVSSVNELKNSVTSCNSSTSTFGSAASANMQKWKSEITGVKVELAQAESSLSGVKAEQNRANAEFSSAKAKVSEIKAEQEQLNQKVKSGATLTEQEKEKQTQLNAKLSQAKSEMDKAKNAQNQVKTKIDQAKSAVSEAKAKQEELNSKIKQGEADIQKEESAQKQLNNQISQGAAKQSAKKSTSVGVDSIGSELSSIASKAMGVVGIATIVKGAFDFGKDVMQTGAEFESAMTKVGTIADTNVKSVNQLSNEVLNISTNTGVASTEVSEAMYQAISAGVDTANATDFVNVALKTAKAGFTDATTSVDGLTSVLNTYGMETTQAEGLANKFLITQNKGKTTFGELAGSIGQVAPVANAAGVSIDELLAGTASLTANGLGTSEAMTGMKGALSNIIKPTTEASKMAEQLGMDFSVSGLKSKGLAGFMQELKEKTGGNTETMAQLFGSVEGLNAMLTLTGDGGMKLMNDTMSEMGTNTTAVDDAYAKMESTVSAKIEKIGTAWDNLKVAMSNGADPAVIQNTANQLAEGLSGMATQVAGMIPQLLGVIATVAQSLGTALPGILTSLVTGIANMLPQLVTTAGTITIALRQGLAQSLPTLIPTLVNGVMNAIASLAYHLPEILTAGMQLVFGLAQGLVNAIPALVNNLPNIVNSFVNGMIANLPNYISTGIQMIVGLAVGLIKAIPQLISAIPKIVTSFVKGLMSTDWKKVGKNILQGIKDGFTGKSSDITATGTDICSGISTGIDTSSYMPVTSATIASSDTYGALSNGLSGTTQIGTNAVNGLSNGISTATPTAEQAAANTGNAVVLSTQNNLGGMQSAGSKAVQDFTLGMNAGIPMVQTSANGVKVAAEQSGQANIQSTFTVNAQTGTAQTDVNTFVSNAGNQLSTIPNSADTAMNKIKMLVSGAMLYCQSEVNKAVDTIKKAFEGMSITIPKPKIPTITVKTETTMVGTQDVKTPKFDVEWHAKGGIFNRPTLLGGGGLHGVGEAGAEAVLPLDTFWSKLREFITEPKKTENNNTNNKNEITINVYPQGNADEFVGEILSPLKIALSNM